MDRWRRYQERLEQFALDVIFEKRRDWKANLTRALLTVCSYLYTLGVQLRLFLFRNRIFRDYTLGCQVISVGNLTVGGTGKTPVVEIFASALQKQGRRVAILSRGYRSAKRPLLQRLLDKITGREWRRPPRVVSDGQSLLLDSDQAGDEPYMLACNLKDVVVLVDKDRVKSGRYAIDKFGADTLLLDDGFQYLGLKSRLDVVLVDRTNPFGTNRLLPRGTLREPATNLRRAHTIFITKSNGTSCEELKQQLRELNAKADIIECAHHPLYLEEVFTNERQPLEWLRDKSIGALSGIAMPEGFEEMLVRLGAKIAYTKRYADHHRFSQQEILNMINRSRQAGAQVVITTQKDAVRFPRLERRDLPTYFLRVEIKILSGAKDFHDAIRRICFR